MHVYDLGLIRTLKKTSVSSYYLKIFWTLGEQFFHMMSVKKYSEITEKCQIRMMRSEINKTRRDLDPMEAMEMLISRSI